MRIFVGIPISEGLQTEILEWEKKHQDWPVRWLKPKNLHISLVPPWQSEYLELEKNRIKKIKKVGHFEIIFKKVEFGPNKKYPRLIWSIGGASEQFIELRKNCEDIFGVKNRHPDNFVHLTLARFNPESFKKFLRNFDEEVEWRYRADSIALYESFPGSEYKILEEIKI